MCKYKYLAIWIYLLLKVNHEEEEIIWNGKKIKIRRGEGIVSQKKIAKKLRISRTTVSRCLKYLKADSMVDIKTTNKFTYVSIINYCKYQNKDTKTDNKVTSSGHQADTNNNDNNENKYKSFSFKRGGGEIPIFNPNITTDE